jgi:hypothetical protein
MATYQAPFQRDAISEVVPRALELSSLSKSSLLTGRRRIRVIPQTGQTYGAANGTVLGANSPTLANILIQDSAGLLDMQSVVLSMNVQVATSTQTAQPNAVAKSVAAGYTDVAVNPYAASLGSTAGLIDASSGTALTNPAAAAPVTTGAVCDVIDVVDDDPLVTAVLDDFAWSVFRRIQISLNSQLVDDLDYAGRRTTTEVYQSASPSWYDTVGTVMGAWKLSQGEFVQPMIIAPQSSVSGGGKVNVATFPVKSRVQAGQWAAYSHQLGIANRSGTNEVFPITMTFAGAYGVVPNGGNALIPKTAFTGRPAGVYNIRFDGATGDANTPDFNVNAFWDGTGWDDTFFSFEFPVGTGGEVGVAISEVVIPASGLSPAIAVGDLYLFNSAGGALAITYPSATQNVTAPNPAIPPLVAPTIALGTAYTDATQPGWLDAGVGALQKLGHDYLAASPYKVSQLAQRPLCLAPDYTAAVARTDVLSKVYATSMFMKDVFFTRTLPSTVAGANNNPPLMASPILEQISLSTTAASGWTRRDGGGPKFSIPLGLISHLFRQEQLFPLRNAGQLIIQIQFADALECCYAGFLYPLAHTGAGANVADRTWFTPLTQPNVGYRVTNLELECDIVTAIPEYTAILDSICARPADKGLAIAFDSHLSSMQQVSGVNATSVYGQAPGNGSPQSYTLIASKGSENVRSFTWTFSPNNGLRSPYYLQNSTFPAYNINQWQIRVGSVYYPAFPSKGLSKNYMEMLSAINAPLPSIGQASLVNYNMYRASTPAYQWFLGSKPTSFTGSTSGFSTLETYRYDPKAGVFGQIQNNVSTGGLLLQDPQTSYMADAYIGSYCFDNLKHAEPMSHDGLDTRAIAGGMIQLDFTCEPLENFCVVFHIRFTRTIVLAENGVSIIG